MLIELQIKNSRDSVCQIKAYFSNQSTAPMEKLMLRLAAPKVSMADLCLFMQLTYFFSKSMQIKMEPQSSQIIPPKSDKSVTQGIVLNNPNKVSYIKQKHQILDYQYKQNFRNHCV